MTMPHLENCSHSGDGWCLACVSKLNARHDELRDALRLARRRLDDPESMTSNEERQIEDALRRAGVAPKVTAIEEW